MGRGLCAYAAAMLRVPGADASHPAAMEAVQAVFLRVMRMDRAALARVEHVQAWMTGAVRNVVLNTIRSGQRQDSLKLRFARDCDGEAATSDDSRTRGQEALHTAMDRLPEDAREVLLLKHVANLTIDQIALSLDVNRSTVASRVRSAMEKLRELLAEAGPPLPSATSERRAKTANVVAFRARIREMEPVREVEPIREVEP